MTCLSVMFYWPWYDMSFCDFLLTMVWHVFLRSMVSDYIFDIFKHSLYYTRHEQHEKSLEQRTSRLFKQCYNKQHPSAGSYFTYLIKTFCQIRYIQMYYFYVLSYYYKPGLISSII